MDLLKPFAHSVDVVSEIRAPYNSDGATPKTDVEEKNVKELQRLIKNPAFQLSDLPAYWDAIKNISTVGLNDRLLLLEKVLVLMSRLQQTEISMKIQQYVIDLLYKDLPHPPSGYLSLTPPSSTQTVDVKDHQQPVKYAFRSADGSNYNPLFPTLGKARSPYARSVPSTNCAPLSALPDPGLVFDTLLRRDKEKFTPHPGGISSLFFAFADLVIHSIFNTNGHDWTINNSSSYLDLSILYGSSEEQVASVRRQDGTGRLWDDVFADARLLGMPPASCALLILLCRNHNYIAQKILDINEKGTFKSPSLLDDHARKAQDDEIFHRSRLVNCGYFMQIILGDYVGAILGLVRDGSSWRLDPLMTMREATHEFAPRGEGNVVSIEFNLLYRWHATLSAQDTKWTTEMFEKLMGRKDPSNASVDEFMAAIHKFLIPTESVKNWTFDGLQRDKNTGRFKDDDLANLLQNATEWRAGAFQARGTPEVLRVIEILGIEQSRSWGTCSMNEFRKFLGLKPYETFKEWNPNEEIHTAAAALYKDINNLELHVGLQAEEAKKPGPGAGLCPGYTISRAILADAVCLTRGDRFLTVDFTPFNLTSWGYQDCQFDTKDGSYGGLLTKLLFRTLPDHYPAGSAYAHFPFLDPKFMKDNMSNSAQLAEQSKKYDWTRPRPSTATITVDTYDGVRQVLNEPHFLSAYDTRLLTVAKPIYGGLTKGDLIHGAAEVNKLILEDKGLPAYFAKKTSDIIQSKSFHNAGSKMNYVDIVKDVINLIPIQWICEEIAGLPLKTASNTKGTKSEQQIYDDFADVARYVYLNSDPVNDWRLRESSQKTIVDVARFLEEHLDALNSFISAIEDRLTHISIANYDSRGFLRKVRDALGSENNKKIAAKVFTAVIPTAALYSQAIAHIVNFYLDEDKRLVREEIVKLATSKDKEDVKKVMPYVLEALRIDSPISAVYRTAAKDVDIGPTRVQAGQRVLASIVEANLDKSAFGPDVQAASYTRPVNHAGISNITEDGLVNSKFFEATVPAILGVILGLKNLQRAPGKSGSFTRFTEKWHGVPTTRYINMQGVDTPWADSLIVQFN